VVYKVDVVVVGASRRKGSTLSFTQNEVVVVLRDLRPEFCVFGGEHAINEGRIWRGTDGGASEVNSCSMPLQRGAR